MVQPGTHNRKTTNSRLVKATEQDPTSKKIQIEKQICLYLKTGKSTECYFQAFLVKHGQHWIIPFVVEDELYHSRLSDSPACW